MKRHRFDRNLSLRIDALHKAIDIASSWAPSATRRHVLVVLYRRLHRLERSVPA